MQKYTTTACGCDAVDEHYGVGYTENRKELSPYPRINRLRKEHFSQKTRLDSQRILYYTEMFKKYEGASALIKNARALEHCLLNFSLQYCEDELLLGDTGGGNWTAQVYPEFSLEWLCDELREHNLGDRVNCKAYHSDQVKEDILSCESFWKGRNVRDKVEARLSAEELKGSQLGKGVFFTTLYLSQGIGHHTPDFNYALCCGFGGIKKNVRRQLDKLDLTTREGLEKREFYNAQLIVLEAASRYCQRYAQYAKELAEQQEDPRLKSELLRMSANCEHIAEEPPRDLWEALQLFHFIHQIVLIESSGHSVSFGRVDQVFHPFYKRDLDSGRFTKEFMQELLEAFWIKSCKMVKITDTIRIPEMKASERTWGGTALVLGGVDQFGNDATNDLTFMFLDCIAHTRLDAPWPMLRWHDKMPEELKIKAAEVIRSGNGHPKLFNDRVAIETMRNKGRSLAEARDYTIVGCVEPDSAGYEYGWHDSSYFNLVKVFELAINNGRCINCSERCPRYKVCGGAGKQLGIATGTLADFKTFDELKQAFRRQLKYWVDQMVMNLETIDLAHQEVKPLPYLSCFINDCTQKGQDVSCGGARYNGSGPQGVGIGTVGDSLSVLKQLIFEENKATGEEFLDALKANWEGHEVLYTLVNSEKVHHYGNDDDYADEMAQFVFNSYCEEVEDRITAHGGTYTPGVYSVTLNIPFGMMTGATPDGRKATESVSDNIGPVHTVSGSHDRLGPTALTNSVAKFDHARATNGTLLNIKFGTETMSGETGRQNFIDFIDSYMAGNTMHVQVMTIDRETMIEAQKNPQDYADLLVRVSGYSAYFVDLGVNLQNDLIARTEQSFE